MENLEKIKKVVRKGENDITQSREAGMSETYLESMFKDIRERIARLSEKIKNNEITESDAKKEKQYILKEIKKFAGGYKLESKLGVEKSLMKEYRNSLMTEKEKTEENERNKRDKAITRKQKRDLQSETSPEGGSIEVIDKKTGGDKKEPVVWHSKESKSSGNGIKVGGEVRDLKEEWKKKNGEQYSQKEVELEVKEISLNSVAEKNMEEQVEEAHLDISSDEEKKWKEKPKNVEPRIQDMSFYEERIRRGEKNIKRLEEDLAKANSLEITQIKKKIDMEKAGNKTIEDKLKIARELEDKRKQGEFEGQQQKTVVRNQEDIITAIQVEQTIIDQQKTKNKFEEYEEKLREVTGGKFDYEIYKRSYLNTLGCEIKYNIWRTKAFVVEKKTGNFIGKNGEIIEKNDKKTERVQFDTAWRFPVETSLIKFLRAQVEKKLTGVQNLVESKPTPEENTKKWREQFGPLAEVQDEIDKYNKEKWREQFGPLAEVQEEIERYKENKPKSFWQKVQVFFSRDKKF